MPNAPTIIALSKDSDIRLKGQDDQDEWYKIVVDDKTIGGKLSWFHAQIVAKWLNNIADPNG